MRGVLLTILRLLGLRARLLSILAFLQKRGPVPCGIDPIQCSSAQRRFTSSGGRRWGERVGGGWGGVWSRRREAGSVSRRGGMVSRWVAMLPYPQEVRTLWAVRVNSRPAGSLPPSPGPPGLAPQPLTDQRTASSEAFSSRHITSDVFSSRHPCTWVCSAAPVPLCSAPQRSTFTTTTAGGWRSAIGLPPRATSRTHLCCSFTQSASASLPGSGSE